MGVGQASQDALLLVTCTRAVHVTQGPIVLIMHQYAYYGKGMEGEYCSLCWAIITLWP